MAKLPFSSAENESTLPVVFSMFEFTKEEMDKLNATRAAFNQDQIVASQGKGKDKGKGFGLFKKKSTKTDGSLNSQGNTNTSQGNR